MKKLFLALAAAGAVACTSVKAPMTQVEWSTLGNTADTAGRWSYVQQFRIVAQQPFSRLAFNCFARTMESLDPADSLIELLPGYYAVASDRFVDAKPGDTLVVQIKTNSVLRSINYAPDGVHLVDLDGKPVAVDFTRADMLADKSMWATDGDDRMPYGPQVYDRNAELASDFVPGAYDVIPSYKSVTLTGGTSALPAEIEFSAITPERPDYYRITVADGRVKLESAPEYRAVAERRFLRNTRDRGFTELPNAVIEDWPDHEYRGLMIDVTRNFVTPAELDRILEIMADYGFNTLHFHFADDEAWRLQFDSLPELTEVGGGRGYTEDESDYLKQLFTGNGDPTDLSNTSNGYFTRKQFVDMLRKANSLGIKVLPEIESPGHARAAIKAMQKRARRLADDSWLINDPADTSRYTSAQSFHDNTLNPAMPGAYRLMEMLGRELKDMYAEAGVELPAIHIGGDEVARGAWMGSPVARKFMEENGIETQQQLHAYFVKRVARMYADMGLRISGWQEIGLGHDEEYNEEIRPNVYSVNCWSTLPRPGRRNVTVEAVEAGYPIVLSNVDHFYMDLCYSYHPYETGLVWGGTVDEFASLSGYPKVLCDVPADAKGRVIGVSGQLFGETLRSDKHLETYLLPKMTGLAERAWNADTTWTEPQFHALIVRSEMPAWESKGYNFHLRQPGVKLIDGKVCINNPYDDGEVRYTTDGTNPTATSALYTAPFDPAGASQVRARLFRNGKESVTTIAEL